MRAMSNESKLSLRAREAQVEREPEWRKHLREACERRGRVWGELDRDSRYCSVQVEGGHRREGLEAIPTGDGQRIYRRIAPPAP